MDRPPDCGAGEADRLEIPEDGNRGRCPRVVRSLWHVEIRRVAVERARSVSDPHRETARAGNPGRGPVPGLRALSAGENPSDDRAGLMAGNGADRLHCRSRHRAARDLSGKLGLLETGSGRPTAKTRWIMS